MHYGLAPMERERAVLLICKFWERFVTHCGPKRLGRITMIIGENQRSSLHHHNERSFIRDLDNGDTLRTIVTEISNMRQFYYRQSCREKEILSEQSLLFWKNLLPLEEVSRYFKSPESYW